MKVRFIKGERIILTLYAKKQRRKTGVYRTICVKFKNKPSYDKIKMS